jgi:hypothetical protein
MMRVVITSYTFADMMILLSWVLGARIPLREYALGVVLLVVCLGIGATGGEFLDGDTALLLFTSFQMKMYISLYQQASLQ